MRFHRRMAVGLALAALLGGLSVEGARAASPGVQFGERASGSLTAAPASGRIKGETVAKAISKQLPTTYKVTRITQSNDPNRLLGRPGGYVSGAWIHDDRLSAEGLGVNVGAVVEVFKSAAVAKGRVSYVTAISEGLGFGRDYITRIDNVVLRVSGELTPSEFGQFKRAFAKAMR